MLALFSTGLAKAQLKVIKPIKDPVKHTNFGLGCGMARSVLYLTRNLNSNNDALGFNTILTFDKGNYFRGSVEYTYYGSINIQPTWLNVKAQTLEANLSVISKSRDKRIYFYPIAGLSYNIFRGYYTGINDFQNLSTIYTKNQIVQTNWLGINTGLGADYNFKGGAIYLSYKMRIGRTVEFKQINIMDVFMVAGLRFYVKGATLYKLFKGTRSRYSLKKPSSS
ncbi:MAG: hypothetical protein IT236_10250 [Bacteroidia bacterium]|nr:hypothetical protein [Bacteroidia bacterium]